MAKRAVCRQTPEVGAECPNWARSDLSGGRSEMSVPTGNDEEVCRLVVSQLADKVVDTRPIQ